MIKKNYKWSKETAPIDESVVSYCHFRRYTRLFSVECKKQTPWSDVFDELQRRKINTKNTSLNSLSQSKQCLQTIFAILDKEYIESITYKDCHILSDVIFNLPKDRRGVSLSTCELRHLLDDRNHEHISQNSAKKYLRTFKELMSFAKKRRYITDSFAEDIEIPPVKNSVCVEGFTRDELKKIFNPETYPIPCDERTYPRFFVPLIALFTGMRLNEICQLYTDDIRCENGVYYFFITDRRPDQHLKNAPSHRRVPIHPMLIRLGFVDFFKRMRRAHKERLFEGLNYSPQKYYRGAIGEWFNRYLKSLGIIGRQKVFHSLRHTVKPYLRDAGVSQEYQNALCGWTARDIGERIYGGPIPIKQLYAEISKLTYPFLERNLLSLGSSQMPTPIGDRINVRGNRAFLVHSAGNNDNIHPDSVRQAR